MFGIGQVLMYMRRRYNRVRRQCLVGNVRALPGNELFSFGTYWYRDAAMLLLPTDISKSVVQLDAVSIGVMTVRLLAIRSAQQLMAIWPVQSLLAMISTVDNADMGVDVQSTTPLGMTTLRELSSAGRCQNGPPFLMLETVIASVINTETNDRLCHRCYLD